MRYLALLLTLCILWPNDNIIREKIRIRQDFNRARDELGLTATMGELSSCTALGLQLPGTADVLMSRILEKVSELTREIDGSPPAIH